MWLCYYSCLVDCLPVCYHELYDHVLLVVLLSWVCRCYDVAVLFQSSRLANCVPSFTMLLCYFSRLVDCLPSVIPKLVSQLNPILSSIYYPQRIMVTAIFSEVFLLITCSICFVFVTLNKLIWPNSPSDEISVKRNSWSYRMKMGENLQASVQVEFCFVISQA